MHSMYNDDDGVTDSFPKMGSRLPFEDVSAEAFPEPGVRPTRTLRRDPLGRFSPKPSESGSGEARARPGYIVRPLSRSELGRVHYGLPRHASDHSYMSPGDRVSYGHLAGAEDEINHRLSCPGC
jgi:hypothetical protein